MMSLYEKCQLAGDKEIHDDYVYIGPSGSGIVEIPLTGRQIKKYYDKMSDDDKNMLPLKRIAFLGSIYAYATISA